jgi:hypothetical protein
MKTSSFFAALVLSAFAFTNLQAAEVMPQKPTAYFNDYAGVVSQEAARTLQ